MDTPALPFCHFAIKAEKPKESEYPKALITVGDRLRAKRLDLELLQKEVGAILGVTEDTICYWENNRVKSSRRMLHRIHHFLGISAGRSTPLVDGL